MSKSEETERILDKLLKARGQVAHLNSEHFTSIGVIKDAKKVSDMIIIVTLEAGDSEITHPFDLFKTRLVIESDEYE